MLERIAPFSGFITYIVPSLVCWKSPWEMMIGEHESGISRSADICSFRSGVKETILPEVEETYISPETVMGGATMPELVEALSITLPFDESIE
ncbi:MAG: hypothetical protein BWX90_00970 [bacterium ADurb.Bin132]|nr:MAG: hypothetical protein BWX90_00970 [bacterium ADurb.Bin132]